MSGKGNVRFSELFRSTAQEHGIEFCFQYYVQQKHMAYWEFRFWAASLGFDEDGYYTWLSR